MKGAIGHAGSAAALIRRGFVYVPGAEIHYRVVGTVGSPLVMVHASPGSSKSLEPLMLRLSSDRVVYAPDTWGNGDSSKPDDDRLEIEDYADVVKKVIDELGLDRVDLYGTHTGACIALELSLRYPERIRRLILAGLPFWSSEERFELLENYAPPIRVSGDGSHLIWAWNFRRDQYAFFPYYRRRPENRRSAPFPLASEIHEEVMELLKSGTTYHLAYNAAFRYHTKERLSGLPIPALLAAGVLDPVVSSLSVYANSIPGALVREVPGTKTPEDLEETARIFRSFLASGEIGREP